MSRKKQLPILENLEIIGVTAEGKSVAKPNGQVVFVKHAVPGDVADIQITRKKRSYLEGRPVKYHLFSDDRVEPFCEHFGICGGCKWQHLNYEKQLHYKQEQVTEQFERIAKIELPEIRQIIPADKTKFYRNKLEFTFSNKKWLTEEEIKQDKIFERNALGFHVPGRFDSVLGINKCWLQPEPSNKIRLEVKKYALENHLSFYDIRKHEGFLRNLIVRTASTDDVMVVLCFGKEMKQEREKLLIHLAEKFPEITSLMYVINPKKNDTIYDLDVRLFEGNDHIIEIIEDLKFKIGPKSFFQTNTTQAIKLYQTVKEFAMLKGDETVYDLYSGIGTITNFIAKNAKKVIGIESVPEAVENAKENASINNIKNTYFFAGDIKDTLTDNFVKKHGKPGIVITDPPRAGMHKNAVKQLLNILAEKIIYVSCNPATQARDVSMLCEKYTVKKTQPVDMFPHTHHIENVLLLEKK
ncbi:MAG: 23S rRNA (uracil(1939)-C(5))-methyltransferase RlmD [Flavobacteriales bacterium]|nr:MAG: 23S rRNA (uracil(1939)-C(5))-methyltransferase RlmD [Flavobacteriales bacterium]